MSARPDLGWKSKLVHVSGAMEFFEPVLQDLIGPADLIVYERNAIVTRALEFITYWQGMGKPVVINLDDAYWMLPWCNPARAFWFEREHPGPDGKVVKAGATRMLEEALRLSDGLVAPNRLLLGDYMHLAGNGYYLQNYAEERWWLGLPTEPSLEEIEADLGKKGEDARFPGLRVDKRDGRFDAMPSRAEFKKKLGLEDRIIIGWGGSLSHYDSWHGSGIFEAARRLSRRRRKLVWMICGNDKRLYDQLPVPNRSKAHHGAVPVFQWPQVVRCFDVGIAPLMGIYDQRRSWIKGIEYALAGCPWVAVSGETYAGLADWPTARLGPETADFWEEALEGIIKRLDERQEQAEALVPEARRRFFATEQLDEFARCYRAILRDFTDTREGLPGVVKVEKEAVSGADQTEDEQEEVEALPSVYKLPEH